MLTIFNNLALEFSKLEPIYSRLRVLGCTYKRLVLTVVLEKLVILGVTMISVLSIIQIFKENIPNIQNEVNQLISTDIYNLLDEPYEYNANPDGIILMRGGFGDIAS